MSIVCRSRYVCFLSPFLGLSSQLKALFLLRLPWLWGFAPSRTLCNFYGFTLMSDRSTCRIKQTEGSSPFGLLESLVESLKHLRRAIGTTPGSLCPNQERKQQFFFPTPSNHARCSVMRSSFALGLLRLKGLDCLVVVFCYYYLLGPTFNNRATARAKHGLSLVRYKGHSHPQEDFFQSETDHAVQWTHQLSPHCPGRPFVK